MPHLSNLKNVFDSAIYNTISFSEIQISTLQDDYKIDYSHSEWKHICLFEFHFSREYSYANKTHSELFNVKCELVKTITQAQKLADICSREYSYENKTHSELGTEKCEFVKNIKQAQILADICSKSNNLAINNYSKRNEKAA